MILFHFMNRISIIIDKDVIKEKLGLDFNSYMATLLCALDVDINKGFDEAIRNGFITKYAVVNSSGYATSENGEEMLDRVLSLSSIKQDSASKAKELAVELKKIYLTGKKPGTNSYWADGPALIARRLETFFRKYGEDFTKEQIINATKKYIESFNGDYTTMRLLKYFIFKDDVGADGYVEPTSDLLNYIVNEGEDTVKSDSFCELR